MWFTIAEARLAINEALPNKAAMLSAVRFALAGPGSAIDLSEAALIELVAFALAPKRGGVDAQDVGGLLQRRRLGKNVFDMQALDLFQTGWRKGRAGVR